MTYTKQLRSARSSMKSNSWLMSYVIDGLLGFILFKCSSYILHTPVQETENTYNTPTCKKYEPNYPHERFLTGHCLGLC